MKKILVAALMAGVMSTGAMARWYDFTIKEIRVQADGNIAIKATYSGGGDWNKYVDTSIANIKEFIAVALTAKSTGSPVMLDYANGKWQGIMIK